MKNKKIALVLAGILSITTILGGCGSKSVSDDNYNKKITIMVPLVSANAPAKDNVVEKKLEELTGYDIEVTWVPNSSYPDKVSITMASDKVPNIMVIQGKDAATISNVKKGAFWKIEDYLKDYENLSQGDENIKLNASFNGEIYGIYRKRDVIRSSVIFRKDWLDKLGLQVPTTLEEFNNVLQKFKDNDPDGDGASNTTGMAIPKWTGLNSNSPFDQMTIWFGIPNTTEIKGGKVVPDFMTDKYMDTLDYFKYLYDNGLMNKDFAVLDSDKWDDEFVNGKAGVIVDTQSRAASLAKKMVEKYGDDGQHGDSYVTIAGNITVGSQDNILPTTGYSGMLMMPKQGVKDENELKKMLAFLDKLNTEEVNSLLGIGIEGTHYEVKDGKYIPTTDKELLNDIAAYAQMSMNVREYDTLQKEDGSKLQADRLALRESGLKKAVFDPCASLISDVYSSKGAQLQNIMNDARIQYIAGQIDKDSYEAAKKQWLSTGGQEYIDELTKLYNENLK